MEAKKNKKSSTDKKKIESLGEISKDIKNGKAKKKTGRPSNEDLAAREAEEQAKLVEEMPGEESFEDLLEFAFTTLAGRLGPHWELNQKEKEKGSVLLHKVAQKYFPLVGQYAAEVALLMWLAPVVLVRAQITIALKDAGMKTEEETKKEDPAKDGQ